MRHTITLETVTELVVELVWEGEGVHGKLVSVTGDEPLLGDVRFELTMPWSVYLPSGGPSKIPDTTRLDWLLAVSESWSRLGQLGIITARISPELELPEPLPLPPGAIP